MEEVGQEAQRYLGSCSSISSGTAFPVPLLSVLSHSDTFLDLPFRPELGPVYQTGEAVLDAQFLPASSSSYSPSPPPPPSLHDALR